MGQFDYLKNPAIFDGLDNPFARIAGAKKNLGMSTLFGVLSNFAQNKKYAVAPIQDTYLNNFVQSTPQYLKDYSNAQIDRSTRGVVSNVLASNPLNRSANTIAVADAQAANAKANLAVNEDKRDIGLRNAYLQAKQRRLDQFGAGTADAENRMIQNSNTQIANYGALGTNYANEMQKAVGNEWAAYDRNKLLKSTGINAIANWLPMLRNTSQGNINTATPPNTDIGATADPSIHHGSRKSDDWGNTSVYDAETKTWIPDAEFMKKYPKPKPTTTVD